MMFISLVLPEPDGPKIATAKKPAAGVSNLRRSMHSILLILVNVIDQSRLQQIIFCMKGGNACPLNCLFCVLSVMIPVSEIDFDLITRLIASAASGHSMIGSPILIELR